MRRWLSTVNLTTLTALLIMSLLLSACGGAATTPAPGGTTPGAVLPPTAEVGTSIAATSAVPTSTSAASAGGALPFGSLVLNQIGQFVAQSPDKRLITLDMDRLVPVGSVNGRYGVRTVPNGDKVDLVLVDYEAAPAAVKDIPNGKGLISPALVWRDDSAGLAFSEIPMPEQAGQAKRAILYFDIASGQTRELTNEAQTTSGFPVPMAFSPDGKYLVYLLSAEGNSSGGALQATLLDTATGQKTPLNLGQHYFTQWLRDSSGFLAQDSNQRMVIYRLNGLQAPTSITPAGFTDLYPTLSPDGKFLAVVSVPVAQAGAQAVANNVFLMGLDGSNRRQLTQFNDLQQVITGLFWGSDGIYYSLYTGESMDKVFRMDLDGQNPTEVASGTLQGIVGLR